MNDILVSSITGLGVLIPALLLHYREIKKKDIKIEKYKEEKVKQDIKLIALDKILDFCSFSQIKSAVDEMFEKTKADRFLILFAINGKTDFNTVSVVFEQHKNTKYSINAIGRYKTLPIDNMYRKMLKDAEMHGIVEVETEKMPDSLLKDIYDLEEVVWSDIRHLCRFHADESNDILVFSSLATHSQKGFTKLEKVEANLIYDSIIKPNIVSVLKKE